jgi:hypothetical protein
LVRDTTQRSPEGGAVPGGRAESLIHHLEQ